MQKYQLVQPGDPAGPAHLADPGQRGRVVVSHGDCGDLQRRGAVRLGRVPRDEPRRLHRSPALRQPPSA